MKGKHSLVSVLVNPAKRSQTLILTLSLTFLDVTVVCRTLDNSVGISLTKEKICMYYHFQIHKWDKICSKKKMSKKIVLKEKGCCRAKNWKNWNIL